MGTWLAGKRGIDVDASSVSGPMTLLGPDSSVSLDALECDGIREWAMEAAVTDRKFPLYQWIVRVGVRDGGGGAEVSAALSTRYLPGYYGRVRRMESSVPSFIPAIGTLPGARVLFGGLPGSDTARRARTSSDVAALILGPISSPGRDVPLVVVSAGRDGSYPVDPDYLARRLYGMAMVVAVDRADLGVSAALAELDGEDGRSPYRVEDDFVIVYRPGADPDADKTGAGRAYFNGSYIDRVCHGSADALAGILCSGIIREMAPLGLCSPADIAGERRTREDRARRERAEAARSRAASADVTQEVGRLRSEVDEWLGYAESKEAEAAEAAERAWRAERKAASLEAALKGVSAGACSRDEALAPVADALEEIPGDLPGLLRLAAALWPDRLVVLPEAIASAKGYTAGDAADEWRVIRALATAAYDVILEENAKDAEGEIRARSGVTFSRGEGPQTRSMPGMMKLRERRYDGRTISIEPHLKGKSGGRDPFRLYFAADRQTMRIVIGHAGSHLDNYSTRLQS